MEKMDYYYLLAETFANFKLFISTQRADKIYQSVHGATNIYSSISVWTCVHHVWHKALHVHDISIQSSIIICTCDCESGHLFRNPLVLSHAHMKAQTCLHTLHTCLTPTLPLHLTDFTYIQIEFSSLCPTNVLTNVHILPSL